MTKGIVFLSDVEKVDAKLMAIALAQAAITIELSGRIGFDLDNVEFMVQRRAEVLRFRLQDVEPLTDPKAT